MKRANVWLLFILLFQSIFIPSCFSNSRTLKNGYSLPEATEENIATVIKTALANLVYVKGGSFLMGDSGYIYKEGEGRAYWSPWNDNFPVHKVTLDSFSISKYEVTYWEYDVYTDLMKIKPVGLSFQHQNARRDSYPVGNVTWQQAQDYCLWLGQKTGLPFSLPTEAQWEYAARSRGQNVGYATDNGKMEEGRNHLSEEPKERIIPVGTFPPNPLGLYEMSGNASEWVLDWYHKKYYEHSPELNPQGPEQSTKYKVLRGGAPTNSPSRNTVYGRRPHQVEFTAEELDVIKQEYQHDYGKDWQRFYAPDTSYYYGIRCVVNSPKPVSQ